MRLFWKRHRNKIENTGLISLLIVGYFSCLWIAALVHIITIALAIYGVIRLREDQYVTRLPKN